MLVFSRAGFRWPCAADDRVSVFGGDGNQCCVGERKESSALHLVRQQEQGQSPVSPIFRGKQRAPLAERVMPGADATRSSTAGIVCVCSSVMRLRNTDRFLAVVALLFTVACATAPGPAPAYVAVIGIATEVAHIESALSGRRRRKRSAASRSRQAHLATIGSCWSKSGVGKVNAAMVATLLVDHFAPSAVLFSGTAGAVDPELGPGDIVIGSAVGYHDYGSDTAREFVRWQTRDPISGERNPLLFPASDGASRSRAAAQLPTLTLKAPESATRSRPSVREGVILTGDSFMANPVRRDELRRTFNASAVEMEGRRRCSGLRTTRCAGSGHPQHHRFIRRGRRRPTINCSSSPRAETQLN